MGAGVMAARAVVRDLFAPSEGARIMSKGLTGLGVIACLSAPVGGLLAEHFGWRVTLLALTVFGTIPLTVVALPEVTVTWSSSATATSARSIRTVTRPSGVVAGHCPNTGQAIQRVRSESVLIATYWSWRRNPSGRRTH